MRPGNQSNKRMRGRGRKGPNPLTRTYESNGPDVKIRGTALHIAEKYQQLARDAQASGDRVMSENYFQHAEHYLRIVAAAQAQNPASVVQQRGDEDVDGQDEMAAQPQARPDRRERNKDRENRAPSVDADSPQPFIDNMPVIDDNGQLNSQEQDASDDQPALDDDADAKPRRRVRGTRGRGTKREAAEGGESAEAPADSSEEAAPAKPKRRTTRRKAADADAEPVPAGE